MAKYNFAIFISFLQLNIYNFIQIMSQELSSYETTRNNQHNVTQQTNQQRMKRIKKSKNIRKQKVLEKRNQKIQAQSNSKQNLTRQQKKQIQKEKNRMAAQFSRDKQKKYVQDLECKITQMQKQMQTQLCRKCKGLISDHSSTQQQQFNYQSNNENYSQIATEKQTSQINVIMRQPELEQVLFIREDSRSDMEWGNLGKYFCMFLVIIAVCLLPGSIQVNQQHSRFLNRPIARILTQQPICKQPSYNSSKQIISPTQLQQIKEYQNWPFKQESGQPLQNCKNDFWKQYLQDVKKQVAKNYDWNLVSCNNPNIVHVSTVYQNNLDSLQPQQAKWTFLISNPTISQTHIQKTGKHYVDQVSYLDGLYQMIAQKVVLKKVINKSCLA